MTPKQLGFVMPGEWEEHDAVWFSWPHDEVTFENRIQKVEKQYARVIKAIQDSGGEQVRLFIQSEEEAKRIAEFLESEKVDTSKIDMWIHGYADVWIRDYGPTFLVNRATHELAMVDWDFNAWGNKYAELLKDNDVPKLINQKLQIQHFEPGIVMEGGSIEVNGKGVVMTTKQCLLNENRNPHLSQAEIEEHLTEYLGCSKVLWLNDGVEGDDTDGHIDDIARFIAPDTIVYAYEDNTADPNHAVLHENFEILQKATDLDGNPFKLIRVPMPGDKGRKEVRGKSIRLPESYVNFLITNKVVLAPVFGTEHDATALEVLAKAFTNKQVVPIDASDWIYGMGTIHCSSQQQPKP